MTRFVSKSLDSEEFKAQKDQVCGFIALFCISTDEMLIFCALFFSGQRILSEGRLHTRDRMLLEMRADRTKGIVRMRLVASLSLLESYFNVILLIVTECRGVFEPSNGVSEMQ
jgi:hypothetical protein